ncbi:MAG: thioredoxin [Clostridiales Family XIII bacterium]|jgi:thioredoxin 1|nr:thioredoxin [Clostridiales Family XIII bacterium]
MSVKILTESTYEQEISSGAVVVDFYADWCGPCKAMAPIFEELSGDYEGKITFAKINVDENKNVAIANKVMSIPTLLIFKDGEQIDRSTGSLSKDQLEAKIAGLI